MKLLALESSCDETAAAVLDGHVVLSDIVSTQTSRHAPFGGVVPEIASREHLKSVAEVVDQALAASGCHLRDLDALAVTTGPGLIGSLFVGVLFAKGVALAHDLPLLSVNHLLGHVSIIDLLTTEVPYPHIALLASGGHTALYLMEAPLLAKRLGTTLDDAAGEAFDKTAKMLGLGYPGGAELARHASAGNAEAFSFPVGLKQKDCLDFSFSGLKTAVSLELKDRPLPLLEGVFNDLCASIEGAIVNALVQKALAACRQHGVSDLLLAGGVAANQKLSQQARDLLTARGGRLWVADKRWCTDNAVMIGAAGQRLWAAKQTSELSVVPRAYWPFAA